MDGRTKTSFAVVGGSRSLGINHTTSDTDLLIVSGDRRYIENVDGYNIIYWSAKQFINALTNADNGYLHIYQYLYPEEFVSTGEITDWIKLHRDEVILENRDVLYRTLRAYFLDIEGKLELYYKIAIKRVTYMLCYGQMLCSYAKGLSLSDCFRAQDAWRNTLLRVMNRQLSYTELTSLVSKMHEEIENNKLKFEPVSSKAVTDEMKNLFLDSEFMSYAELKEVGMIQPFA